MAEVWPRSVHGWSIAKVGAWLEYSQEGKSRVPEHNSISISYPFFTKLALFMFVNPAED